MHQFAKVELVSITTPEQSEAEHERMPMAAEDDPAGARAAVSHDRCSAPATWALPRARPTTSKSGCPGRTPIARSRPARTAATSRRGAWMRATGPQARQGHALRPHAQRLGPRGRPHAGRGAGELSAGRRHACDRARRCCSPIWAAAKSISSQWLDAPPSDCEPTTRAKATCAFSSPMTTAFTPPASTCCETIAARLSRRRLGGARRRPSSRARRIR